ncbi:MAG: MFS transporter [Mariprofundaceae bacterium]
MRPASPLVSIRMFYASYFAGMGLILPFFPIYLARLGWDNGMVGLFVGILAFTKVLSPPVAGHLLDQSRRRHAYITAFILAAALAIIMLPLAEHALMLGLLILIFGLLWSAALPLTDGISLVAAEASMVDYGRLRVWGSIGFVISSLAGGAWMMGSIGVFPFALALLLAICAFSAMGFPVQTQAAEADDRSSQAFSGPFRRLLATSFAMQASHGAYYGFFSLYLLAAGYSGWQIGLLWSLGVLAEIVLMWRCSLLIQQAAPALVLSLCLLLAALRWLGIGLSDEWPVLVCMQLLHAATFAAFHVSAVTWAKKLAPSKRQASAQGWYSASGFGLGTTLGVIVCGWLAEQASYQYAFYVCAIVALLGLLASTRLPRGSTE